MLTDLRSALFWAAVGLLMLVILQRGCQHRMDKFQERWDDRREQREQRREDRQDQDDHKRRWRRHSQDSESNEAGGAQPGAAAEL